MTNKDNFFLNTIAEFKAVAKNLVKINKPDYESVSGSKYWYTQKGVYRYSDHWGNVASCYWELKTPSRSDVENRAAWACDTELLAFCRWENFGKILTLRDCEESFRIGYESQKDTVLRNYKSFEHYFEPFKEFEEYEEGKEYVFYEFNYLFKSKMKNARIEEHPNHYNTETIAVVEDFDKFKYLLELENSH
jgi:hypothetical protein